MDLLAFRICGEELALSLRVVREVSTLGPVTRVPGAAPALCGVLNLRGSVVPAVNVAVRLGRPLTRTSRRAALIVVNAVIEGGPSVAGLVVEALGGIVKVSREDVRPPPPGLFAGEPGLVLGLAGLEDRLVPVLDVDALVDPSRLALAVPEAGSNQGPADAENAIEARPCDQTTDVAFPVHAIAPAPTAFDTRPRPREAARGFNRNDCSDRSAASVTRSVGEKASPVRSASPPPLGRNAARPSRPQHATSHRADAATMRPRASLPYAHAPDRPPEDRTRRIYLRDRTPWPIGMAALGTAVLLLLLISWSIRGWADRTTLRDARPEREGPTEPSRARRDSADTLAAAGSSDATRSPRIEAPRPPPETSEARGHGAPAERPAPSSPRVIHEVLPGESLWAISDRYFGNALFWPRLFAANRDRIDHPDHISPGQRLSIPRLR